MLTLILIVVTAAMQIPLLYCVYRLGYSVGSQRQLSRCCEDLLQANLPEQTRHLRLVK